MFEQQRQQSPQTSPAGDSPSQDSTRADRIRDVEKLLDSPHSTPVPAAPLAELAVEPKPTVDVDAARREAQVQKQSDAFTSAKTEVSRQAEDFGFQRARALYKENATEAGDLAARHKKAVDTAGSPLSENEKKELDAAAQEAARLGAARWSDAIRDASELQVAMTGADDELKIFEVLERSNTPEKIAALKEAYRERYGKDLEADLKWNLGGSDEELAVVLLSGDKVGIGAAKLLRATRGAGTDEAMIKDVYQNASAEEIKQIEARFNSRYSSWTSGWGVTSMGDIDSVLKAELNANDLNEIRAYRERSRFEAEGISAEAVDAAARIEKALSGTFSDDEDAAIDALRTLTPEQRATVSAAYEMLYNGGSLEARLSGELTFKQWEEARQYLENDPQAHVSSLERAIANDNYDVAKSLLSTESFGNLTQAELRERFKQQTGVEVEALVREKMYATNADALVNLLETGKVDEIHDLRRAIIGYTSTADEQEVLKVLQGKTKAEIADLTRRYEERFPGSSLMQDVVSNLGGREEFLATQALKGEPESVADLQGRLKAHMDYESSGWLSGWGCSEYTALKKDMERFERTVESVPDKNALLTSLSTDLSLAIDVNRKAVESSLKGYGAQQDLVADRITTGTVIVACTIATLASAGAGAPLWGVALAAGSTSFASKFAVKSLMRGGTYDYDEVGVDAATSSVEGVAALAGGVAGAKALSFTSGMAVNSAAKAGQVITTKTAEGMLRSQMARGLADAGVSAVTNGLGTGAIQGDVWEDGVQAGFQRLAISAGTEFFTSGAMSSGISSLASIRSFSRSVDVSASSVAAADAVPTTGVSSRTAGAAPDVGVTPTTTGAASDVATTTAAAKNSSTVATSAPSNNAASATTIPDAPSASQVRPDASVAESTVVAKADTSTTPSNFSGGDVSVEPGKIKAVNLVDAQTTLKSSSVDARAFGLSSAEPRSNVVSVALEMVRKGDATPREVLDQLKKLGIQQDEFYSAVRAVFTNGGRISSPAEAQTKLFKKLLAVDGSDIGPRSRDVMKEFAQIGDDSFSTFKSIKKEMFGVAADGKIDSATPERLFELRDTLKRAAESSNPELKALAERAQKSLIKAEEDLISKGLLPQNFTQRMAIHQLSTAKNVFKLPDDYLFNGDIPVFAGTLLGKGPDSLVSHMDALWRKADTSLLAGNGSEAASSMYLKRQNRFQLASEDLGISAPHLDARYKQAGAEISRIKNTKTDFDRVIVPEGADRQDYMRRVALIGLMRADEGVQRQAVAAGILKPGFVPLPGKAVHIGQLADTIDLTNPQVNNFVTSALHGRYQEFVQNSAERMLQGGMPSAKAIKSFSQVAEFLGQPIPSEEFKKSLLRREMASAILSRAKNGEPAVELADLVKRHGCQEALAKRAAFEIAENPRQAAAVVTQLGELGVSRKQFYDSVKEQLDHLGRRGAEVEVAQRRNWFDDKKLIEEANVIEQQVRSYEIALRKSGLPYRANGATAHFRKAYDDHFATLPEPLLWNRMEASVAGSFSSLAETMTSLASKGTAGASQTVSNAYRGSVQKLNGWRRLAAMAIAPRGSLAAVENS